MFRSQHKTRRVQTAPAGLGLFIGQHTTDSAGLAAAAIIMTVPALVVYVLLQGHFIRGVSSGSVKGLWARGGGGVHLKRERWLTLYHRPCCPRVGGCLREFTLEQLGCN